MKPIGTSHGGRASDELCYAYVFARGGSKGLPRKNLKTIGGISLVGRAILAARQSRQVRAVIVSTDCPLIARESLRFGALVPTLRPMELATDTASEWTAWQHAIEQLSPRVPDIFVSVPPTAPLRNVDDIDSCIHRLRESQAELVLTVTTPHRNPYFNQVRLDPHGRAGLVMADATVRRRQDAPPVYDITTVAYAARPAAVLGKSGIFECDVAHVEVPVERSIDIDTPLDFSIAEFLHNRDMRAAVNDDVEKDGVEKDGVEKDGVENGSPVIRDRRAA